MKKQSVYLCNRHNVSRLCYVMFLFLLGTVFGHEVYAQRINSVERTITGRVIDQVGEPLPGVNVMQKGTTNGTITDMDGKYSLIVSAERSILVFSYIGYHMQEITVGNKNTIDVKMQEDLQDLEEVVVI